MLSSPALCFHRHRLFWQHITAQMMSVCLSVFLIPISWKLSRTCQWKGNIVQNCWSKSLVSKVKYVLNIFSEIFSMEKEFYLFKLPKCRRKTVKLWNVRKQPHSSVAGLDTLHWPKFFTFVFLWPWVLFWSCVCVGDGMGGVGMVLCFSLNELFTN